VGCPFWSGIHLVGKDGGSAVGGNKCAFIFRVDRVGAPKWVWKDCDSFGEAEVTIGLVEEGHALLEGYIVKDNGCWVKRECCGVITVISNDDEVGGVGIRLKL